MSILINKDTRVICQGITGAWVGPSTLSRPSAYVAPRWLAG